MEDIRPKHNPVQLLQYNLLYIHWEYKHGDSLTTLIPFFIKRCAVTRNQFLEFFNKCTPKDYDIF